MSTINALAAQRIHALILDRAKAYRQAIDGQTLAANYLKLALRLPTWVHHNGLTHTVRYLRSVADNRSGQLGTAAAHLLFDWLESPGQNNEGWHLRDLAAGEACVDYRAAYRVASDLARREADWFKRFAQSELDKLSTTGNEAVPEQDAAQPSWLTEGKAWWPASSDLRDTVAQHPGLFWRFGGVVPLAKDDSWRDTHVQASIKLMDRAGDYAHGRSYFLSFYRRQAWFEMNGSPQRAEVQSVSIKQRLKTGVGEPGVFECQVALHPTSGLPRLPASGLRGLLKAWCLSELNEQHAEGISKADLIALFGNRFGDPHQQAGLLVLHDAWWDPASTRGPLELERDTTHHPEYYAGNDCEATDFDDPIPNPQLAVAGKMQLIVSHANIGPAWAKVCMQWLCRALAQRGAGASKNTGYGRFEPLVDNGEAAGA
jgi:CRISPR type III-B/RAMP module RAMP protein Cmr6